MLREDGEAVKIVQRTVVRDPEQIAYIAMGGGRAEDSAHLVTAASIVGCWEHNKTIMNISEHPACAFEQT